MPAVWALGMWRWTLEEPGLGSCHSRRVMCDLMQSTRLEGFPEEVAGRGRGSLVQGPGNEDQWEQDMASPEDQRMKRPWWGMGWGQEDHAWGGGKPGGSGSWVGVGSESGPARGDCAPLLLWAGIEITVPPMATAPYPAQHSPGTAHTEGP